MKKAAKAKAPKAKTAKAAAPKRAKAAAPKATAKAKTASKPSSKNGVSRSSLENSGHIDPDHAQRLLELSRETKETSDDRSFVTKPRARDGLAERMGEEAVDAMTSGEDATTNEADQWVEEEEGGPFVETTAEEEFADDDEAPNVPGAMREPFPRTSGGKD
jgi:hypothetical protein